MLAAQKAALGLPVLPEVPENLRIVAGECCGLRDVFYRVVPAMFFITGSSNAPCNATDASDGPKPRDN